jgi:hypothetical protein
MAYKPKKPGARKISHPMSGLKGKDPKWKRAATEAIAISAKRKRDQDRARPLRRALSFGLVCSRSRVALHPWHGLFARTFRAVTTLQLAVVA